MRIKFTGRRGISSVILGGVLGEDRIWSSEDEPRSYAPDQTIQVRTSGGIGEANAIFHILSVGPEFVDADTGKNPLFLCADCGQLVDGTAFRDNRDANAQVVYYKNGDGKRLCVKDFLAANPQYIPQHRKTVYDQSIVTDAQELADQRGLAAAQAASATSAPARTSAAPAPAQEA